MATVEQATPPLEPGDFLTREEFLRRWEADPTIKRAELIGGVVYMPSPVSVSHGDAENDLGCWLGVYKAATRGCACGHNTTTMLLKDSPQPDLNLRILPEYGGTSWVDQKRDVLAGTPELFVEVCQSSTSYDLHQKLELYQEARVPEYLAILLYEREVRWQEARVPEYLAILLYEREVRWHVLKESAYQIMLPGPDGVWRSQRFPGLWLNGEALFAGNLAQVLATLQEGIASKEHQDFVTS